MSTEEVNHTEIEEDFVPTTEDIIRERIIHTLTIYPKISPSMLQVGIGTALAPRMWRPVFDKLLKDGIIQQVATTSKSSYSGRDNTHLTISLVHSPIDVAKIPTISDGDGSMDPHIPASD